MGKNPPIERGEEELPPGIQEVNGYRLDFSGWTLGDLMDYNKGVTRGDLESLVEVLSKTIKSWPFESDPRQTSSYRAFGLKFWREEVLPQIWIAVAKEFPK